MHSAGKWICASLLWGLSVVVVPAQSLSSGMSGEAVMKLQNALSQTGYYARTADGEYGSATAAAVRLFQKEKGLSVTGTADERTQKAIEKAQGKAVRPGGGIILVQGNRGTIVQTCQEKLRAAGFLSAQPDGVYGSRTKAAVELFQKDHKLPVTGMIDEATMRALDQTKSVKSAKMKPAVGGTQIKGLRRGDSGERVVKLQNLLILHGYNPGMTDGDYGSGTEQAVKQLQRVLGMKEDGVAGDEIWAQLQEAPAFPGSFRQVLVMNSTAYTPYDEGTTGYTASGNIAGKGHAAVDPSVIPLGTMIYIEGYGYALADDIGGAIGGHTVDVGVDTLEQAYRWGRRDVKVYIM